MKTKQFTLILLFSLLCMSASADDGVTYRDVTTTGYGQLEGLLGEDIMTIDSLVVRGPINKADFTTMWKGGWSGKLQVINLEHAAVENNKIPDAAFWNIDVQMYDPAHNGWSYVESLRRVILPEGIVEIGKEAFRGVVIKEINLPSSLRIIGDYAFSNTDLSKLDASSFPDNLEEIGAYAFARSKLSGTFKSPSHLKELKMGAFYISRLSGKLNLPPQIKTIDSSTFHTTEIESVNLENVNTLCTTSFANCRALKKVIFPRTGITFDGEMHFAGSSLEEIELPEDMTTIPTKFLRINNKLKHVKLPGSIKKIDAEAFYLCSALESIELPEGLESIENNAFNRCTSLITVVFPSTLSFLGKGSCLNWQKIEGIYCKSIVPPTCEIDGDDTPFKTKNGSLRKYMPVYVPQGTAEAYKAAPGWDHFNNYIELAPEDFPASVDEVTADSREGDGKAYDLSGRRVINPVSGQVYIKDGKKFLER